MLRGNDYVIARPKHWVGTHTLTIQTHSVDCNRISLGRCSEALEHYRSAYKKHKDGL
jgi:hypothetical protein